MAITSKDVAREAGVSQPTVSRALSGDTRVAKRTHTLVVEAAQRLGYFPNAAARTLITNRASTVGVVVGDVSNLFFAEQLNALYYGLFDSGYRVVPFQESSDHKEVGEDVVPLLLGNALDGVIFTTGRLTSTIPKMLIDKGTPVVLLNRYIEGADVDRVIADNLDGGRLAARHLVELGHRRIGLITGPKNTSTTRDRAQGFGSSLQEFGLRNPKELRRAGLYSYESGYRLCLELLKGEHPPTAIFCANDVIALGALNAAAAVGVEVPEELSLIGFDDLSVSGWEKIGLSTIHQPIVGMAETASRMLVERIELTYNGPPRSEVVPTHLVERKTTAPPR